MNHSKSREICKKQLARIKDVVEQLHEVKQYPMSELYFLEECVNEIMACRQVLKYTYVIDYYARDLKEHERSLFNFQQGELETSCEKTHQLLESDLNKYLDATQTDTSIFYRFKSEVVTAMDTLRKSFKSLVDDTIDNPKFVGNCE